MWLPDVISLYRASMQTHTAKREYQLKKATVKLIEQRESNEKKISELKSENRRLTTRMCDIEGLCPQCENRHYPHC